MDLPGDLQAPVYNMKIPKSFVTVETSIKSTKLRYRLLADGTIIDQETGKTAGWISSKSDLDVAWRLGGNSLQKFLKDNYVFK